MAWFYASQVTIENGSDIARVVSGEYVATISPGDEFKMAGFEGEEVLNAYTEDGTNDQIIQLAANWPNATQTLQPAKVKPYAVHFNAMVEEVADVRTDITSRLASFIQFGSQATGTVTFSPVTEGDDPIVIRSIGQYQIDLDALESQVSGSVDDVNAIDTQVNGTGGLIETVNGIDATLQGYVSSANTDATKAQEYAVNGYSVAVSGTSDYSALHHATDSQSAKVLAVAAKEDTEGFKSDVETLKSQTNDIYGDAYALATTGVDVEIDPGVFSLKHYLSKTQQAAAQAQAAVSSVTSGLSFVGPWAGGGTSAPPPPFDNNSGNPMYKITVQTVVDGITYDVNDNIVWDSANSVWDGSAWTTEKWFKIDNTETVASVNGKTGVVVIAISDIAGLQTALDNALSVANSKVAQTTYDADQSTVNGRLAAIELDANIQMWSIRR